MTGRVAARRRLAVGVAVGLILATTLTPAGYAPNATPATCLFCGARGAVDAINNVLLFLPLGLALAASGARVAGVLGAALALSILVEALQLTVVSRYSSLGDVAWNALGAALGLWLWRAWPRLRPAESDGPGRAFMAAGGCIALVAAVAVLLKPAPPGGTWYIHWLRNLSYAERYGGRILDARVGGQRMAPWREYGTETARAALLARGPVRLDVEVGPPTRSTAALLTLLGARREEILYLGVSGQDVVEREYRVASALKFATPARRARAALAGHAPGDTVRLELEGAGRNRCLTIGTRRQCGLDVPLGRSWMLFAAPDWLPEPVLLAADVCWMVLLFAPVGFWSARRLLPAIAALTLGAALLLVPLVARTIFVTWPFVVVALLGVLGGAGLRRLVTSRSARSPSSPSAPAAGSEGPA